MIAGNRISARLAMERVLGADKLSDAVAGYGIPGASAEVAVSPGDVHELGELLAESTALASPLPPSAEGLGRSRATSSAAWRSWRTSPG